MLKITVTCFALVSVLFLGKTLNYADQPKQNASGALTGTLQKMIVENGSVTMNLDLNGLNGSNDLTTRPVTLQFAAGTNSFLPILVLNDELRGLEPGSIALVPQGRSVSTASRCVGSVSKAARRRKTSFRRSLRSRCA